MTVRLAQLAPLLALAAIVVRSADGLAEQPEARSPEARAIAFLSIEVPKWSRENACFSCHNNGDAARALMAAARSGMLADRAPLADTLRFLEAPEQWDANGPDGEFKDEKLARIQFAAALAEAADSGLLTRREPRTSAAGLVADLQTADGGWQTGTAGVIGSPVTYGAALASFMAVRALEAADSDTYDSALRRARRWFETAKPKNVLDAAAILWALAKVDSREAASQRAAALELIRQGEAPGGGWGPFVNAPPQVFDTAIVILALAAQKRHEALETMIARGRAYLIAMQSDDGGWPATTRPPAGDSYAQRLSTSGWALQALLSTRQGQSR